MKRPMTLSALSARRQKFSDGERSGRNQGGFLALRKILFVKGTADGQGAHQISFLIELKKRRNPSRALALLPRVPRWTSEIQTVR
jgi:hypothetical protein